MRAKTIEPVVASLVYMVECSKKTLWAILAVVESAGWGCRGKIKGAKYSKRYVSAWM